MAFINATRRLEKWNMSCAYSNNISFIFLWHLSVFLPNCSLWSKVMPRSLLWKWTPPEPAVPVAGQIWVSSCRPYKSKSLWDTILHFPTKLPLLVICIASTLLPSPPTQVIFYCKALSFFPLCIDQLWLQDQMTPYIPIPNCLLASNKALLASPTSIPCTEQGKERRKGSCSLAHVGLSKKAFSSECHQQQMAAGDIAVSPQGCKQPHPHESGCLVQLHPLLTSPLYTFGCSQSLRRAFPESCNLCERPREKQKGCRRISLQESTPCPSCDYRQYLPYFSKGNDISFPSGAHGGCPACGRAGYAMMSFQRRAQGLTSVWRGGFSCFGAF